MVLPGESVELAIAEKARPGCYPTGYTYDLIADPKYGTAIQYGRALLAELTQRS